MSNVKKFTKVFYAVILSSVYEFLYTRVMNLTSVTRWRQLRQLTSALFSQSVNCFFIFTFIATILAFHICHTEGISTKNEGFENITNDHRNDIADKNIYRNMLSLYQVVSNHDRVLSRHRRYLTFPEGSSFQVVYDQIVGVVDYTNYLILGITAALAWELPSKPPSEILIDLKTRLNDGTFGISRNDTVMNMQTPQIPLKVAGSKKHKYKMNELHKFVPKFHSEYHSLQPNHFGFNPWTKQSYQGIDRTSIYPYVSHKKIFGRHQDKHRFSYKSNPLITQSKSYPSYSWRNLANSQQLVSRNRQTKVKNIGNRWFGKKQKHRIYPVFGKRSTGSSINQQQHQRRYRRYSIRSPKLSKLDRIHIRHHRSTRQNLYSKIEKYLSVRGSNGHQCVLKALCETGQKENELVPGTFVGEIMRAIFTMPEAVESVSYLKSGNNKHQAYDMANAYQGDCAARYHLCEQSLWKADFVA